MLLWNIESGHYDKFVIVFFFVNFQKELKLEKKSDFVMKTPNEMDFVKTKLIDFLDTTSAHGFSYLR